VRTLARLDRDAPALVGAGLIDWPGYRLIGRCWPCGRLVVLHTPWALFVCERTPLPIEITEQGMARLDEAVVPVSNAKSAA
jgi:hypothetical protein